MLDLVRRNPNLLVPHFLIHSYLYYVLDASVISDAAFDQIVKELGEKWESVEHIHKDLIDRSLLKTGFYLEYPPIVEGAAKELVKALSSPIYSSRRRLRRAKGS